MEPDAAAGRTYADQHPQKLYFEFGDAGKSGLAEVLPTLIRVAETVQHDMA
jgi:hypothetical protein